MEGGREGERETEREICGLERERTNGIESAT